MTTEGDHGAGQANPGGTVYFTVVTKSYLAHARTLAAGVRAVDPGARFLVFLADEPDGYFDPAAEPFACARLADYVPAADRQTLAFAYTCFEWCNALKAYAHLYVQNHTDAGRWVYLDSDIFVLNPLGALWDDLADRSVAVTPHVLRLRPDAADVPREQTFLRHGVFNGGFLAVRRNAHAARFLEWFLARMRGWCLDSPPYLYVDQLWLDLLAGTDFTFVWKHPGANVGYWNLPERPIEKSLPPDYRVEGSALLFVHFSGFERDRPEIVSSKETVPQPASGPWSEIAGRYRQSLCEHGVADCERWPYTFGKFSDGTNVESHHRETWCRLAPAEKARLGNPFDAAPYFRRRSRYHPLKIRILHRLQRLVARSRVGEVRL